MRYFLNKPTNQKHKRHSPLAKASKSNKIPSQRNKHKFIQIPLFRKTKSFELIQHFCQWTNNHNCPNKIKACPCKTRIVRTYTTLNGGWAVWCGGGGGTSTGITITCGCVCVWGGTITVAANFWGWGWGWGCDFNCGCGCSGNTTLPEPPAPPKAVKSSCLASFFAAGASVDAEAAVPSDWGFLGCKSLPSPSPIKLKIRKLNQNFKFIFSFFLQEFNPLITSK